MSSGVEFSKRLLHALELAVEHLAAQQVLDLLESLPRLGGAPVVLRQRADRPRRVVGEGVELGLGETRVVGRVRKQRLALLLERLLQQLAHLLEGAVEATALAGFAAALLDLAAQVVQPAPALGAAAQQGFERLPRGRAFQDRLAHLVQGSRGVEGRRERIRAAVPGPVPVARDAHP